MKPAYMKTPNLIDLYSQRASHDLHRKKLQKIRQQRKSHLGYDHSRFNIIQSLKQSKNRSFINKFNRTNQAINKQNIAFLGKLQRARPLSRYSQNNDSKEKKVNRSYSFMNPYIKKKVTQTQQENMRISTRLRSLSSALNAQKMDKDYQRTQQIRKRLQRYVSNENKVSLKSQKYLQLSKPSNNSPKQSDNLSHSFSQKAQKRTTASHYNAQQITKNKVYSGNSLLKIRKRYNLRPNTTNQNVEQSNNNDDKNKQKQESFFTTQPTKVSNNKEQRRNIYI